MSEQVAKQALERFFEEYDYIWVIQIFIYIKMNRML